MPVTVEAERSMVIQMNEGDRAGAEVLRLEDGQIAPFRVSVVDERQNPSRLS